MHRIMHWKNPALVYLRRAKPLTWLITSRTSELWLLCLSPFCRSFRRILHRHKPAYHTHRFLWRFLKKALCFLIVFDIIGKKISWKGGLAPWKVHPTPKKSPKRARKSAGCIRRRCSKKDFLSFWFLPLCSHLRLLCSGWIPFWQSSIVFWAILCRFFTVLQWPIFLIRSLCF